MNNRFIQIHNLTSYPAALLNRDDAGFAKRMPFGGAVRTRISSQCLKRHWRIFRGEQSLSGLEVPLSVRSRQTFEKMIVGDPPCPDLSENILRAVTAAIMDKVLGKSEKAKKEGDKKAKEAGSGNVNKTDAEEQTAGLQTSQITVLGLPEIEYLHLIVHDIAKEVVDEKQVSEKVAKFFDKGKKENLKALKLGAGLDAALFGRMVTSDVLARCDAAIHVANALTVHEEASEPDYFSAVDDLVKLGSAHVNSNELTSGMYYGYVVVDVTQLISNLEGCKPEDVEKADGDLAANVVQRLIHLIATVSPGAKLGSTAPYASASMTLVECGNAQPRTLANAFLRPVPQQPDVLENAYLALANFVKDETTMYGKRFKARLAGMGKVKPLMETLGLNEQWSLDQVSVWAGDNIRRG